MAVSKHTRSGSSQTDPFFLELLRKHPLSGEREQTWRNAVQHAGTGTPPLRFPVYEHLYRLNACAQEMVELLEQLSGKFSVARDPLLHCQSLIQYVRASASQGISEMMAGIEITEAWLFENQQLRNEKRLRDPDDVYASVREREAERISEGLSPRIRFLDGESPKDASKRRTPHKNAK